MVYDVCFLLLQSIAHDARTLNLARTLKKHGKSILLLGIGTAEDGARLSTEGIDFVAILPPTAPAKLALRWLKFHSALFFHGRKYQARIYCAEDVFTLPSAFMLASGNRARLVYDSREIFSALASNHSRPLRQKMISSIERYYIPKISRIFTSGDLDSDYLATYLSIPRPDVVMNLPPYSPAVKSDLFRALYRIPNEFKILLYQGWIAEGRGILHAVRSLRYLPDIALCLLGDGEYQTTVRETAQHEGVADRVYFCGKVPYDRLAQWTAAADAGLCFIEPITLSYSFALPNKLFEYCMAGIPSLVSDLPAMRHVTDRYPIGKVVSPDSTPEELAAAIRELFSADFLDRFHSVQASAARTYCWENQESTVLDIFALEQQ